MRTFKDRRGNTWTIDINVLSIKKIRAHCNINLLDVLDINQGEDGLLARLADDPVLLADILYAICVPDKEKDPDAEAAFMAAIAGDVVDQATWALLEDIADFFPKAKGAALRKVIEIAKQQEEKTAATVEEILNSQDLQESLAEAMSSSSPLSTNSQESSASTPPPSPSAS